MSVETKKVLEMLAAGKITLDDAERLLDKLAAVKELPNSGVTESQESSTATPAHKYLRILVKGDGKDVNMRVPLSFLRSGVGLIGVLPAQVAQKLNEKGLNLDALSKLRGENLNEVLDEMHVDVDTQDGKHVQIFCE